MELRFHQDLIAMGHSVQMKITIVFRGEPFSAFGTVNTRWIGWMLLFYVAPQPPFVSKGDRTLRTMVAMSTTHFLVIRELAFAEWFSTSRTRTRIGDLRHRDSSVQESSLGALIYLSNTTHWRQTYCVLRASAGMTLLWTSRLIPFTHVR